MGAECCSGFITALCWINSKPINAITGQDFLNLWLNMNRLILFHFMFPQMICSFLQFQNTVGLIQDPAIWPPEHLEESNLHNASLVYHKNQPMFMAIRNNKIPYRNNNSSLFIL